MWSKATKSTQYLEQMEDAEDDIAVIGIGCNFPGGKTKPLV